MKKLSERISNIMEELQAIKDLIPEEANAPESDEQVECAKLDIPARLTVSDYSRLLGVSRNTVYKWEQEKLIIFGKSGKYTLVVDYPGKAEGVIRMPTDEEIKETGFRFTKPLGFKDKRLRKNGGGHQHRKARKISK